MSFILIQHDDVYTLIRYRKELIPTVGILGNKHTAR